MIQVWRNAPNDLQSLSGFRRFIFCGLEPAADRIAEEGGEVLAGWIGAALVRRPTMVATMITHETHHRGQVCMLANQLGFRAAGCGDFGDVGVGEDGERQTNCKTLAS
jgi:hypothetical protein